MPPTTTPRVAALLGIVLTTWMLVIACSAHAMRALQSTSSVSSGTDETSSVPMLAFLVVGLSVATAIGVGVLSRRHPVRDID